MDRRIHGVCSAGNSDSRRCASLRDGVAYLAIIQKLYGSFKGDAFDKRVLPFFHVWTVWRACLPMQKPLKAAISHDADPTIGAPEPLDQSPGNHDSAANDVTLSHCEHAIDR